MQLCPRLPRSSRAVQVSILTRRGRRVQRIGIGDIVTDSSGVSILTRRGRRVQPAAPRQTRAGVRVSILTRRGRRVQRTASAARPSSSVSILTRRGRRVQLRPLYPTSQTLERRPVPRTGLLKGVSTARPCKRLSRFPLPKGKTTGREPTDVSGSAGGSRRSFYNTNGSSKSTYLSSPKVCRKSSRSPLSL